MGAEFIAAVAPRIKDVAAIKAKIGKLTHDEIAWGIYGDTTYDSLTDPEEHRERLYDHVDYLVSEPRTMSYFTCDHGDMYMIIGDMSWGDSPEGAESIWDLVNVGVL